MTSKILALLFGSSAVAGCGTTIQPGERGIKYIALRDGSLETEVRPEGFYWQGRWNDIIKYQVTLQSKTEPVEVLTAEALHINTRITVTFRPDANEIDRLQTEIGRNYYDEVIRPAFVTIVRSEFARQQRATRRRSRIFGYEADEKIGQSIAALLPPGRLGEEPAIIERLKKGESRGTFRIASGQKRPVARAKEVTDAANREFEAFSSSVAHDLRAPLRGIDGFSQALDSGQRPEQTLEALPRHRRAL